MRGPPTPCRLRLCSAKEDAPRPDGRAPRPQLGGGGGGTPATGSCWHPALGNLSVTISHAEWPRSCHPDTQADGRSFRALSGNRGTTTCLSPWAVIQTDTKTQGKQGQNPGPLRPLVPALRGLQKPGFNQRVRMGLYSVSA